jgi:hypothetical protein
LNYDKACCYVTEKVERDMSKELSKVVGNIMDSITAEPKWDKNNLQVGLKESLLLKRGRATSQSDYLGSLHKNINFL